MDRACRPHAGGAGLRHGPDGPQPRDPRISEELRPSSAQLLWILDIYGFLVAGLLVTMGTLGDRIGRRKLLLGGSRRFRAGVLLAAAFSTSSEMLIVSRAVMGVAGATIAPSTLSLIFTMFLIPKQRSTAIGFWVAAYSAGGAIGPVLGGMLLEFFWWGSVFLIGVPVMGLLLVLGPRTLPEYRDPNAGRLDLAAPRCRCWRSSGWSSGSSSSPRMGGRRWRLSRSSVGLLLGVLFVATAAAPAVADHRRDASSGSAPSACRWAPTSSASSSSLAISCSSRSTSSSCLGSRRLPRHCGRSRRRSASPWLDLASPRLIHDSGRR